MIRAAQVDAEHGHGAHGQELQLQALQSARPEVRSQRSCADVTGSCRCSSAARCRRPIHDDHATETGHDEQPERSCGQPWPRSRARPRKATLARPMMLLRGERPSSTASAVVGMVPATHRVTARRRCAPGAYPHVQVQIPARHRLHVGELDITERRQLGSLEQHATQRLPQSRLQAWDQAGGAPPPPSGSVMLPLAATAAPFMPHQVPETPGPRQRSKTKLESSGTIRRQSHGRSRLVSHRGSRAAVTDEATPA